LATIEARRSSQSVRFDFGHRLELGLALTDLTAGRDVLEAGLELRDLLDDPRLIGFGLGVHVA
jgi:hypothetical protein